MTKLMKFGVGQGVKRVEDVRLVSGRGNYASDAAEGAAQAVFLRSPYAHAKFRFGDIKPRAPRRASRRSMSRAISRDLGDLPCHAGPERRRVADAAQALPGHGVAERCHVGDIVAMAVAETSASARDAVEAIDSRGKTLPAVVDMEDAVATGAPQVFAGAPGNRRL